MAVVHLFVSTGRFTSFEDMRRFIDQTYTQDGDGIDSAFAIETGLEGYEPACIEALFRKAPVELAVLLERASYADQWIDSAPKAIIADSAICVFEPNTLRTPEEASVTYVGAFHYEAAGNSQW